MFEVPNSPVAYKDVPIVSVATPKTGAGKFGIGRLIAEEPSTQRLHDLSREFGISEACRLGITYISPGRSRVGPAHLWDNTPSALHHCLQARDPRLDISQAREGITLPVVTVHFSDTQPDDAALKDVFLVARDVSSFSHPRGRLFEELLAIRRVARIGRPSELQQRRQPEEGLLHLRVFMGRIATGTETEIKQVISAAAPDMLPLGPVAPLRQTKRRLTN